eukprot:CAMPEP_0167803492 /NCGR_PEP_ID=MMETSP0111_2-20121227/19866_1 /TAXON_ID=91324 /ORGANISM="Lotharella globosa, Strain CCCM811" /LENGTH=1043 /DNA_ID=CAMNT_0007699967 /DNA_START=333 /DNA_END=3461 /DNA_ORIENTATION=+
MKSYYRDRPRNSKEHQRWTREVPKQKVFDRLTDYAYTEQPKEGEGAQPGEKEYWLEKRERAVLGRLLFKGVTLAAQLTEGVALIAKLPPTLSIKQVWHGAVLKGLHVLLPGFMRPLKMADQNFDEGPILAYFEGDNKEICTDITVYGAFNHVSTHFYRQMIMSALRSRNIHPHLTQKDPRFNTVAEEMLVDSLVEDLRKSRVITATRVKFHTLEGLKKYLHDIHVAEGLSHVLDVVVPADVEEDPEDLREWLAANFQKSARAHPRVRERMAAMARLSVPISVEEFIEDWAIKSGGAPLALLSVMWNGRSSMGGAGAWRVPRLVFASVTDLRLIAAGFQGMLEVARNPHISFIQESLLIPLDWVSHLTVNPVDQVVKLKQNYDHGTLSVADARESLHIMKKVILGEAKSAESAMGKVVTGLIELSSSALDRADKLMLPVLERAIAKWDDTKNRHRKNNKTTAKGGPRLNVQESGNSVDMKLMDVAVRFWLAQVIETAASQFNAHVSSHVPTDATQPLHDGDDEKKKRAAGDGGNGDGGNDNGGEDEKVTAGTARGETAETAETAGVGAVSLRIDADRLTPLVEDSSVPLKESVRRVGVELASQLFRIGAQPLLRIEIEKGLFDDCQSMDEVKAVAEKYLAKALGKQLANDAELREDVHDALANCRSLADLKRLAEEVNHDALVDSMLKLGHRLRRRQEGEDRKRSSVIARENEKTNSCGLYMDFEQARELAKTDAHVRKILEAHDRLRRSIDALPTSAPSLMRRASQNNKILSLIADVLESNPPSDAIDILISAYQARSALSMSDLASSVDGVRDSFNLFWIPHIKWASTWLRQTDAKLQVAMMAQGFSVSRPSVDASMLLEYIQHSAEKMLDTAVEDLEERDVVIDKDRILQPLRELFSGGRTASAASEGGGSQSEASGQKGRSLKTLLKGVEQTARIALEEVYREGLAKPLGVEVDVDEMAARCRGMDLSQLQQYMEQHLLEAWRAKILTQVEDPSSSADADTDAGTDAGTAAADAAAALAQARTLAELAAAAKQAGVRVIP